MKQTVSSDVVPKLVNSIVELKSTDPESKTKMKKPKHMNSPVTNMEILKHNLIETSDKQIPELLNQQVIVPKDAAAGFQKIHQVLSNNNRSIQFTESVPTVEPALEFSFKKFYAMDESDGLQKVREIM